MTKVKLMEKVVLILSKKGQKAAAFARLEVLKEKVENPVLRDALRYFIEDWNDFLHPGLLCLSCEAAGGNPNSTTQIGAAIVLLAGGADIHDDVIDKSIAKGSKQTVFGKFGIDISVLAGDALLLKGLYLLHESCDLLADHKKRAILKIVKDAFLESSSGEAMEVNLKGSTDIAKENFLTMINQKVATAEAVTRIGAVLGNATKRNTSTLGHYGRTIGILMTLRDEFVDVFEKDELMNRAEREILPLPILLALDDETRKAKILGFFAPRRTLKEEEVDEILDLLTNAKETQDLLKFMKKLVNYEKTELKSLVKSKKTMELLLDATLEDL